MRKLLHILTITTAVFVCGFSDNVGFAQDKHAPQIQVLVEAADSVAIDSLPKIAETQSKALNSTVVRPSPDSSAPPLTRVFVNSICTASAGTGCESIASGQTTTANTYSGDNIYAFVWEIGYGFGEVATQGSAPVSSANLVGKLPVCIVSRSYTTNCPTGSTIVGYRYEWNVGYYLNMGYAENFVAQDDSEVGAPTVYTANLTILYSY